ncbi:nucleoside hydrolase-like domain-containing protein [Dactylosporangium sp. NPDC006015]|uniref:DUF1593 domain-containing protein n=1 Tax=Dactylosporangium sp. NPDC006015 TaxID=3154576 RepID=UPI0033B1E9C9
MSADAFGAVSANANAKPRPIDKPRVIITTDGEGDDIASMHRFLLYANDFDVEGIVTSASRWHWAGDPTATPPITANRWHGTSWIPAMIDGLYRQAHPNLVKHDPRYPTPEHLLSVVKDGNITAGGEMAKDTPGSDLIKKVLLDNEPGPVYLQAWGGTNTIAAALRSIRDEYQGTRHWDEIYRKVSDKAFIYVIQDQDLTYKDHIAKAWPQVSILMNREQFEAFAYGSWQYTPQPQLSYFQKDWIAANIQKGPYAATYPVNGGVEGNSICRGGCAPGDWFSEGDSPSFLHTIPTGLGQLDDPTYGGWGGRFVHVKDRVWADDPAYLGGTRPKATDLSPYPILNTTLAAAAPAGSTNVKVARVRQPGGGIHNQTNDFLAGNTVTIGTGSDAETRTVTLAGGGGAGPTTLFDAAPAGATNIKVTTVTNYFTGDPLTIGTGDTAQTVTVTDVGTQRVATTAAAAAAPGDTVLKVASTGASCNANAAACFTDPVMRPGDQLRIGTGTSQFTVTIKAVGTPFATGSGVTLQQPLPAAVSAGTAVADPGSGITFTPALKTAQTAGATASTLGGGLTLDRPLTRDHVQGAAVADFNSPGWPQARWTDAVQNDMAARIDWTFKGFADANHPPVPTVASCDLVVKPGRPVQLVGKASDPDRDKLTFAWYQYAEAGTYPGRIALEGASTRTPSFEMPEDAQPGQTVHVILAVTDSGATPLTRYQRVIVTAADSRGKPADTSKRSGC